MKTMDAVRDTKSLLKDVIEWDIPNWAVALSFWRQVSQLSSLNVDALELGSRHGGLSLWLALQGANVLCTDLSGPSHEAHEKHARYGVANRVRYASVDAVSIPYTDAFDIVAFKSILGGVGWEGDKQRQRTAIEQIYGALRPGGELWFAENVTGSPLHRFVRRRFVPWGRLWRYPSIVEMQEFTSAFQTLAFRTVGVLGAFGRSEMQRSFLGRVDRVLGDRLVPDQWRYIMIGVARKRAS